MSGAFLDDAGADGGGPVVEGGADGAGPGLAANRRTFLKAAVLGVGAAAVGKQFLPLEAYADDLSSLQCTANDVRIVGAGLIINEPCVCNGTFNAVIRFRVKNNASADRYCIRVHLCASSNPNIPQTDLILTNSNGQSLIPGKTEQDMFGTISNYPCGSGLVCFGEFLGTEDADNKGVPCPEGSCCTTVTWNVVANDPCPDLGKQIPSKCRHQQVCIQGRGATTIDCDVNTAGSQNDCTIACGSTTTIRLCTTGGPGPYTFTLRKDSAGGQVVGGPVTQAGLCKDFQVGPVTATTTFVGTVSDADGCAKSASVVIRVTQPSATINVAGQNSCDGTLTLTASVPGFSNCGTPVWKVDDVTVAGNANGSLTYRQLDGLCHTVTADVNCGGCTATGTKRISQCVSTTLNCT